MTEKDFIRFLILKLIIVPKESVFDLWDEETVELPNNYLDIIDEITSDDVKSIEYSSIIPRDNKDVWRNNVQQELINFLNRDGVISRKKENSTFITLNHDVISSILFDKSIPFSEKNKVCKIASDIIGATAKSLPTLLTYKINRK